MTQWHLFFCVAVSERNLPQIIGLCGTKKLIWYYFSSYWNIKNILSFKRKWAEKPPYRTRKSLDIFSHLTVSALPLSPDASENRTAILVFFPTDSNTVAFVYLVMSWVASKYPDAPWIWIRNKRIMSSYDKSQCDSTSKMMLIWMPVNFWYSEFEKADGFTNY